MCAERILQLEDSLTALGGDIPRATPKNEALLSEILDFMVPKPPGKAAPRDQSLDKLEQTAPESVPLQSTTTGVDQDLQPLNEGGNQSWDAGFDLGVPWDESVEPPATALDLDFEMPYLANFPVPFPDALDLPWDRSEIDAFLQGMNPADQNFIQVPHQATHVSSMTQDNLDDEEVATTDDDSENEIIEQLSSRMGNLYLTPDGTLRYLGATSNMTLAQDWALRNAIAPHRPSKKAEVLMPAPELNKNLNEHLESLYFNWQNTFLHIIDQEAFVSSRARSLLGEDSTFYSDALRYAM